MPTNLNEKYLYKFLSLKDDKTFGFQSDIVKLLKDFGIDIKIKNYKPVYDIIDSYEKV